MAAEQNELKQEQEQDAVLREAQRKNAIDSASFLSAASVPQQAQEEEPVAMETKEGDLPSVFKDQQFLQANNLRFTLDKEGDGGTLTPTDTKEGEAHSYSVHFAPNTGGGFTATITGDINKGLDAAFTTLKEAGVQETVISGKRIETDDAGYNAMKLALQHDIIPVLAHKGVYGSVELFAQQGEKENSQNNEAATKKYLESIVANEKLRPQLVDDMVAAKVLTEAERDTVTKEELIEKGLKDVMSKAQAAAENEVKMSPANAPEAEKSPSAPQDSSMINSRKTTTTETKTKTNENTIEGGVTSPDASENADDEDSSAESRAESRAFLNLFSAYIFAASASAPAESAQPPAPAASAPWLASFAENAPAPTPRAELTLEEQANKEIKKCLEKAVATLSSENVKSGNINEKQQQQLQLAAGIAKDEINDNDQLSAPKKERLIQGIDAGLQNPGDTQKNAEFIGALKFVQNELKNEGLQSGAKANTETKSQPAREASQSNGTSGQGGVIRIEGNSITSYSGNNMDASIKKGSNGSFEVNVKNRETGQETVIRRDQSGNVTIDGHQLGNYPKDQLLEISPSPKGLIVNGKSVEVSDQGLVVDDKKALGAEAKAEATSKPDVAPASAPQPKNPVGDISMLTASYEMKVVKAEAKAEEEAGKSISMPASSPASAPQLGMGSGGG